MTDAFSSPEHPPRHMAPPDGPALHSSRSYAAYPWPPQPLPEPERRTPRSPAHGHHSDLRTLRGAYRWQRRVATFTALGYFTLFLVLSALAPSLMTRTVWGGLSTGLLVGLLQVPVTCLSIGLYEYTARRRVDPIADRIRRHAELDAKRRA
ncbi:DUF485 domain-containing protein [Streptomyces olivochromogenes]|uniref:DUF485 domain-containing protein n=1 Tax=Streptomyces olivochromogenes TaxID=1963 RepID=UPI001F30A3BB|nr:DUF485 domain-containing protein [Streptomyces olivochromogenes]MCF3132644.1 DUF485 domain-containing protein [Streptomyces olivochromogenes]